jgi:hypothetical protein
LPTLTGVVLADWLEWGPTPGIQRIVRKRMKAMELLAFLCVACLLAVKKNGMIWVTIRRVDGPKSKNASKLLAADGRNHSIP